MRNYQKEYAKEKESKISKIIKIDKNVYNQLCEKLSQDNKTFSSLVKEKLNEYIKQGK